MSENVSFIGLGAMGSAMAQNLMKSGVVLHVYNRTRDKLEEFTKAGALPLNSPKEAFEKAPIVFSIVSNEEALKEVTYGENGILASAKPESIHVSMTTISPLLSRELYDAHEKKGVHFLAAPLFGRPKAAVGARLWVCLSGDKTAKKKIEPFFYYMVQKIQDFGELPETAYIVKLIANFLVLTVIESLSEGFAIAKKSGIDPSFLLSFLTDSMFPAPVYKIYGELILAQQFDPPGLTMTLGLKDIDLFMKTAVNLGISSSIGKLLEARLKEGIAKNRGQIDWAAISLSVFEDAGIELPAPVPSN